MTLAPPSPSARLYRPEKGGELRGAGDERRTVPPAHAGLTAQMRAMLSQRSYPCIAALRSFFRDEYLVGVYRGFGGGADWADLRADVLWFIEEAARAPSPYLTLWAVFPDAPAVSEDAFEAAVWSELSHLTSIETKPADWGACAAGADDPASKAFSLRLDGHDLFVVGLHPQSSRASRRFPWTALVFNAFDQFERLKHEGVYDRMVATNRAKDRVFQGDENPMAAAHGETWEAIQFSGRNNPSTWKCPFRFLAEAEKPAR